jgi:hypothetical protein
MRRLFLLITAFLTLGVILALSGCEGPTGPEGPEGGSGTLECMKCHSESSGITAIEGQYENSVHNKGIDFERNTPPCSGCHTHEGFLARLATGDPGTPPNPSTIHCFTCHEPHTSGNFNLRTQAPVTLMLGGTFDRGHGNLCANCHQGRVPSPTVKTAPDSTNITSNRWGPHHSMQSNMLVGSGGHEFAGFEYEDSPHTVAVVNGCPSCHMATPYGAQAGGHSMNMTYLSHGTEEDLVTGCNAENCHYGAVEDFSFAGAQAEVELLMEDLNAALLGRSLIDADGLPVPGKRTEAEAGAVYNFLFVEGDRSLGIHNTEYAVALLESSLSELGVTAPSAMLISNNEVRRFLR